MNKFIVFIYTLLFPLFVSAVNLNDYVIKTVSVDEGLSSSAVLSIYQDDNGLMWFGTYDGLNCYDGKTVHVFRSKGDRNADFFLKSNIINEIKPADNHCFWIQSNLGLSRFSQLTHRIECNYDLGLSRIFSNKSGNTWLINGDTLFYYNVEQKDFLPLESLKDMGYRHFFVADNGNLWAITENSMHVDVFSLNSFGQSSDSDVKLTKSRFQLHDKAIIRFYSQQNTFCFIDENNDLYFYDMERKTNIFIRNITQILQEYGHIENISTLQDDIIIAFHLNGLIKLDADNKYEEVVLDRSVHIFKIYKDVSNNILWIGTDGQGIMMLMEDNSIASSIELSELSPFLKRQVRTIATDKYGGLWFGTKGDGLIYLPSYTDSVAPFAGGKVFSYMKEQPLSTYTPWMKDVRVFCLKESKFHDGMWIGGSGFNMLSFYSFKQKRFIPVKITDRFLNRPELHGIYEQNDSTLWASMGGVGLVKMIVHKGQQEFEIKQIKNFPIFDENGVRLTIFFAMENSGDSLIWLGDRGHGLIRFSIKDETYKVYSFNEKLKKPVDDILSIYVNAGDTLYIGTTVGLVTASFKGEELQKVDYIGLEEGLSNDMVHGVRVDNSGMIWLSTNMGLQKYNVSNGGIHSFYGRGIKIREFSDGAFYKCPYTNRLFFGGVNGLLYLHENDKELSIQKFHPDIIVRKFYLDKELINNCNYFRNGLEGWKFSSDYGVFVLDFIAPDYMNEENIEYSYKLEGFDKDWSKFAKNNVAIYSKVPSGKYTFKIRYKCDVNNVEHLEKQVPVYIYDRWYKSSVFKLFLLFFAVLSFYLLFKLMKLKVIADFMTSKQKDEELKLEEQKPALSLSKITRYNTTFVISNSEQQEFVDRLIQLIEESIGKEELGISYLASELCMSTRQFYRKFNEVAPDAYPGDLIKECRLEKAAELLQTTNQSVQDVSMAIGFNSRSYFYKEFVKKFGVTPKEYRDRKSHP